MAVIRAYTVPWPPLSACLADDSSDADAKRRDAKLPGADASPQTDADADAVTIIERRRRRDRAIGRCTSTAVITAMLVLVILACE